MTRQSFVQIDHVIWDKADPNCPLNTNHDPNAPAIMGDLPDFVSPIDGKTYSGRSGMREHNRKHGVVPTADCAGLPLRPPQRDSKVEREAIAHNIANQVYHR